MKDYDYDIIDCKTKIDFLEELNYCLGELKWEKDGDLQYNEKSGYFILIKRHQKLRYLKHC